jgi:hypothetical protein
MLTVDPTDECTFWFTSEYYTSTSSASWKTHIGTFSLPGCGATPPPPALAAPSALSASATSATTVAVAWTDNSGSAETGFEVERCTGGGCSSFARIATTAANATSYQDGAVAAATTYGYRVRAVAGTTGSDYSNVATVTTPPPPPSGAMTVSLAGSSAPNGRNGWRAIAGVTVRDGANQPMSGATVSGSFSNNGGSGTCTTDGAGACSIQSSRIGTNRPSVVFTVTSVTHPSLNWTPVPTTVTIYQP